MLLKINQNFNKINFINFLLSFIPLSFILGNLAININIFILIISSLLFYQKKIFKINFCLLDHFVIILFSFILFTGLFNTFNGFKNFYSDFTVLIKTFSYLRYLLLYFVIRYLVEYNIVNFKIFFLSASIFSVLVATDVCIQYIYGKDFFGFEPVGRKFAGPFNDELISGGYMQRFSFFLIFLTPIFYKVNSKILILLTLIFFSIFFISIALSGNRMPFILFIFISILALIFEKQRLKYLISLFLFLCILLISAYKFHINYDQNSKDKNYIYENIHSFVIEVKKLSSIFTLGKINRKDMPDRFKEFETFYDTWLMNKYVGGGVKSFRINCPNRKNIDRQHGERGTCNTHPHNYYLEILSDLGLVGFFVIIILFVTTIYFSIFKRFFLDSKKNYIKIIAPFSYLLLAEIFPIKSTGSFFTTGNSTYLFLILAFTIALYANKESY
jgi:O-antigen ligase